MCFVRVANDNDRAEVETLLLRSYPALMKESYPPDVLQAGVAPKRPDMLRLEIAS
jgi:hypothetical protein